MNPAVDTCTIDSTGTPVPGPSLGDRAFGLVAVDRARPSGRYGPEEGSKREQADNNDAFHWIHCVPNSSSQVQSVCIYCCHCRPSPFNRLSISGWCRLVRLDERKGPSCFQRALGPLYLSIRHVLPTFTSSFPTFSLFFSTLSRSPRNSLFNFSRYS